MVIIGRGGSVPAICVDGSGPPYSAGSGCVLGTPTMLDTG